MPPRRKKPIDFGPVPNQRIESRCTPIPFVADYSDILVPNQATGTHCSDCGTPQYDSPSGVTCKFGHGGAPALEDTRGPAPVSAGDTKKKSVFANFLADEDFPDRAPQHKAPRPRSPLSSATPVYHRDVVLSRVNIPTTRLVEIAKWPSDEDLTGALVKYAPVIQSSKRAEFDGERAKKEMLEAGAYAVMLAPRVVPDGVVTSRRDQAVRKAVDGGAAISAWFKSAAGLSAEKREAATEAALKIYDTAKARK